MRIHSFVQITSTILLCLGIVSHVSARELGQVTQGDPELVIPAGTTIPVVLSAYLNTRSTQIGDKFYADTTYPIWIQQRLVIPRGSIVQGSVTRVERPGKVKGKGRIAIRFETILLPNGVSRELLAELHGIHGPGAERIDRQTETVEMAGSKGEDSVTVVGNSGQGAIIGAIAGGGQGAGIGAGVGGAVGLATVLLSRGRELILTPGTLFDLVLKQPLRFAYGELSFTSDEMESARHTLNARRYNRDHNHPPYEPPGQQDPRGRRNPFPWFFPW